MPAADAAPETTSSGARTTRTAGGRPGRSSWPGAGLTVLFLAAQGAPHAVPALDEQADQPRGRIGPGDQVAGLRYHRPAVGHGVGVGHEPPGHVGGPVTPGAGDDLEVAL